MMFGWQTKIIILVIGAAIAFGAGWRTRDAFCDAAEAKRQVETLRTQIKARDAATAALNAQAAADILRQAELEKIIDELNSKVSDGVCFADDDAERVRQLWRD